jgi:hypothetical protein
VKVIFLGADGGSQVKGVKIRPGKGYAIVWDEKTFRRQFSVAKGWIVHEVKRI